MALQLTTSRSLISKKLAGAFIAIFALFIQPLVALDVPSAFAATNVSEEESSLVLDSEPQVGSPAASDVKDDATSESTDEKTVLAAGDEKKNVNPAVVVSDDLAKTKENSTEGTTKRTVSASASLVAPETVTVCDTVDCDYTDLQSAIDAVVDGGTVVLGKNIVVTSQINVTKPLTIEGGNEWGLTAVFAKTDNGNNSAISIVGTSGVTLQNMYINGEDDNEVNLHGVNVYESSNVFLNNLNIREMSRYGVVVNSSLVSIDSITTSGNGWGGINVDTGTSRPAEAILTGESQHDELNQLRTEDAGVFVDNTTDHQYFEYPAGSGFYTTDTENIGKVLNRVTHKTFDTIQAAINDAQEGSTIEVSAGTYIENVVLGKAVNLIGEDQDSTVIVATNANSTPLTFATSGASVSGFTFTHDYTPVELSTWNFNNNGVTFNQGTSGNKLEYSTITRSRNGVYMNNASAELNNNTITNNRTGINTTNTINGSKFIGNSITENWTVGWVYYQSGMASDFSTLRVTGNIFDNWYSEIVIKDAPGSSGLVNVSNNTFGDNPVTRSTALPGTTSPSIDEPGFAAQNVLGGSATAPSYSIPTLRIYNSDNVTLAYTPQYVTPGEELSLVVSNGSAITFNSVTLSSSGSNPVVALIPEGTAVTASNPAWDGTVNAPAATSIKIPGKTTGLAISVGSDDYSLTFDKAVMLYFPGQAGKQIGFKAPHGNFTEITAVCSSNDSLGIDSANECKINDGVDLYVWTKHFTVFATYTNMLTPFQPVPEGEMESDQGTVSPLSGQGALTSAAIATNSADNEDSSVLGTATDDTDTSADETTALAPSEEGWKLWGIAWYWWLLALGALGFGSWYAVKRYRGRDAEF